MAREPITETMDPRERIEAEQAFREPATGQEIATFGSREPTTVEISDGVITARRCEVLRDEARVLVRIKTRAAMADEAWYYRFPVKKKGGGLDYIEGPSIDCADAIARLYGNCQVDCRVIDAGATWIIYARFVDYETGYSLTRPFQQDKNASRLGGEDLARKRDISFQIGVSKAERNVVTHALREFTDFAFEEAKKSLVAKIGGNLKHFVQRCADELAALDVDVARVEAQVGRPLGDWLAPNVARVIAEIRAVKDGMSSADETWPKPAPPEPRRNATATDVEPGGAAKTSATAPAAESQVPAAAATADAPAADAPQPKIWTVPDNIVGQENLINAWLGLIEMTETEAELDDFERQNAERMARVTGVKKSTLTNAVRVQREVIRKAGGQSA